MRNTKITSVRFSPKDFALIEAAADRRGLSNTSFIRSVSVSEARRALGKLDAFGVAQRAEARETVAAAPPEALQEGTPEYDQLQRALAATAGLAIETREPADNPEVREILAEEAPSTPDQNLYTPRGP